ncbi:MAG: hypothetical protein ABIE94_07010 [archaeon]
MINLGSYIFSIPPDVFEKIKPLLEEIDRLDGSWNDTPDEKRSEIIEKQSELKDKIEKLLLNAEVKKEELEFDADGDRIPVEMGMILGFRNILFLEIDPNLRSFFGKYPLSPEEVKKLTNRILYLIENADAKQRMLDYVKNDHENYPEKRIDELFDIWISMLKYSSEHGNWLHYHID